MDNLELNDRGLNGDLAIQDDVWTIPITWNFASHGELNIELEVSDLFGTVTETWKLNVSNRAPILSESSLNITQSSRLTSVEISAKASDANGVAGISVDLNSGGELFELTKESETWLGEFIIPDTIIPELSVYHYYWKIQMAQKS